jgi:hypothetical protein
VTEKNRPAAPEPLKEAVERLHGRPAAFVRSEALIETFRGQTVWEGEVSTFTLRGHSVADTCFAWKETDPETGRDRYFAVLKVGPVKTPLDAVRASIVKDYRESR